MYPLPRKIKDVLRPESALCFQHFFLEKKNTKTIISKNIQKSQYFLTEGKKFFVWLLEKEIVK